MLREALWLLSNWIDNGIKRHRINQNRTLLAEIRLHDCDIIAKCKRLILDSVNTFQLRASGPRKRPKKLGMYYKQVINRLGVMRAAIMTIAMVNKTKAKWSAAEFSGGTHWPLWSRSLIILSHRVFCWLCRRCHSVWAGSQGYVWVVKKQKK